MADLVYCILDTETTDLAKGTVQPYICQIAAVKFTREANIGVFNSLVDPEIPANQWSKEAMEITGIGPEEVEDADPTMTVLYKFAKFMVGVDHLGAYNLPFDIAVISAELQRQGLEYRFPWAPMQYDVATIAESYISSRELVQAVTGKRGVKQPKLEEAFKFCFDQPMEDAHDALADVWATVRVYRHIMGWSQIPE